MQMRMQSLRTSPPFSFAVLRISSPHSQFLFARHFLSIPFSVLLSWRFRGLLRRARLGSLSSRFVVVCVENLRSGAAHLIRRVFSVRLETRFVSLSTRHSFLTRSLLSLRLGNLLRPSPLFTLVRDAPRCRMKKELLSCSFANSK